MIDISIVIVNYNVKDYLYKCLQSVRTSSNNLKIEVIVVDNNSSDNSVEILRPSFNEVNFIQLNENIGFGKANNLGIKKSNGKYILILNPDTILEENTLTEMYEFMENHPNAGISTCKVLNGDGTFQSACRRGFPTPFAAFSKLFGLQALFPKSKLFGKYNLTYMSENETYKVDAVSGSFMFCRRDVLVDCGGFDTDFFMYGEDIDLCYRVAKSGYDIYYYPECSIIHYKGESTKRSNINEVSIFYGAMEIFVRKHYSSSGFFLFLLRMGIFLRTFITYFNKYKRDVFIAFSDASFLTIGMLFGSTVVFGNLLSFPEYAYPLVFVVPQIVLIIVMLMIGEYFEGNNTITKSFFGYTITFLILSTLTYFFPDYRFSRGVVVIMIGSGIFLSSVLRIFLLIHDKYNGEISPKRILLISNKSDFIKINNEFGSSDPGKFEITGFIDDNPTSVDSKFWLGTINQMSKIIEDYKINNILITDESMDLETIRSKYAINIRRKVKFHFVKKYQDLIVSEIINDIIELNPQFAKYKINLLRYRIIKRAIDIIFSALMLLIFAIFSIFSAKIGKFMQSLWNVFTGKWTLIGIYCNDIKCKDFKHGLLNFVNVRNNDSISMETINKLNEYYLKNYSLSLDFDILLRKIIGK